MPSTVTPKQLARQLGVDPKLVRRHLRAIYGTHHKAWDLSSEQVKAVEQKIGKKEKKGANKPEANQPAGK